MEGTQSREKLRTLNPGPYCRVLGGFVSYERGTPVTPPAQTLNLGSLDLQEDPGRREELKGYEPCEDPRPHAWSMCAACCCPCMTLSRATPLGRSRYPTSQFPTISPTHTPQTLYLGSLDLREGPRRREEIERPRRVPCARLV